MVGRCDLDEIRCLPRLKVQSDVLQENGLMAFHGEVIVRPPFLNQRRGQVALGQQGIGGEVLAVDIDGVEPAQVHEM